MTDRSFGTVMAKGFAPIFGAPSVYMYMLCMEDTRKGRKILISFIFKSISFLPGFSQGGIFNCFSYKQLRTAKQ